MRLLAALCTVLPVLGLTSQVLAATPPKQEPAKPHAKSVKVAPKKVERERQKPRDRKTATIEHVTIKRVERVERKVRDELTLRGHGEPTEAELMEWLSHGAPHQVAKKSDSQRGGVERASAKRGGAPKLEKSAVHVSGAKPAEKKKVEEKKIEEKKIEEKKIEEKRVEKKAAKIVEAEKKKTEAICLGPKIDLLRGTETDKIALTHCDGKADAEGVLRLSVMARPGPAARPATVKREEDLGPFIKKVDQGLAERVAVVANHFASKGAPAAIEIISGYRPNSKGSYHSHARAMDIRVQGARNEDVVAFCKTLQDTGCGYYPNSGFVHVDVRDPGTGHISWIDASGPGETPRYVATWPAPGKSDDAAEPTEAKAKSGDAKSDDSDAKAEAADKSAAATVKADEDAQAQPEHKATPSKPEESVKPSAKAKPEPESDLPKLPKPATGD